MKISLAKLSDTLLSGDLSIDYLLHHLLLTRCHDVMCKHQIR